MFPLLINNQIRNYTFGSHSLRIGDYFGKEGLQSQRSTNVAATDEKTALVPEMKMEDDFA